MYITHQERAIFFWTRFENLVVAEPGSKGKCRCGGIVSPSLPLLPSLPPSPSLSLSLSLSSQSQFLIVSCSTVPLKKVSVPTTPPSCDQRNVCSTAQGMCCIFNHVLLRGGMSHLSRLYSELYTLPHITFLSLL